jgi:hypothetical protein
MATAPTHPTRKRANTQKNEQASKHEQTNEQSNKQTTNKQTNNDKANKTILSKVLHARSNRKDADQITRSKP